MSGDDHILLGAFALILVTMAYFIYTYRPGLYWIRLREQTIWGAMFEIVSPDGEVVGMDRYIVARQRCHALNCWVRDGKPEDDLPLEIRLRNPLN